MRIKRTDTRRPSLLPVALLAAALGIASLARAATTTIQEVPLAAGAGPSTITAGPDGALWFAEETANKIGRLTTADALREFRVPTAGASVGGITRGPDGNVWFLETKTLKIARLVPSTGQITEFPTPVAGNGIVTGSDGNLWVVGSAANRVLVVSTAGAVLRTLTVPTASAFPHGPTLGPDGNVYFAEVNGNKVARVTPAGAFKEWRLPQAGSKPLVTSFGPDGRLYFTENAGNRIGRLDTATGAIVEFPIPTTSSAPQGITAGSDGNLWFTENKGNKLGRVTTGGAITEFPLPIANSGPKHITNGPDGNLWFAQATSNDIGVATPPATTTSPPTNTSAPTISGSPVVGQTLSAAPGAWTGSPTFAYAWQQCDAGGQSCKPNGSVGQTYAVAAGDVGATLRVTVTGTNGAGSAAATSSATGVVASSGGGGQGGGIGSPPSTPVLDAFNRPDGPVGANWAPVKTTGFAALKIVGNVAVDASSTQFAWDSFVGPAVGPDCEAYVTVANYGASDVLRVGARISGAGTAAFSGYFVSVSSAGVWSIIRIDNGGAPTTLVTGPTQPLASGDRLAIQIVGSRIGALHFQPGSGWATVTTYDTSGDAVRYTGAGAVGIELKTSSVDDFGGGTI